MNCPLCGSKQSGHFLTVKDRLSTVEDGDLIKCNTCELIYTEDTNGSLKDLYINEYYWHLDERRSLTGRGLKELEEWFIELFLYPEIRAFCSRVNKKTSRILEIGCGTGLFLKILKERGFSDVMGVEMDTRSVEYGRRRYGVEIVNSEFRSDMFEAGSFDAVILNHVLEHVNDPVQFLFHIKNITKNNGLIAVSVPNIESLQAKTFRGRWFGIEYPRHRCHFSAKTLKKMSQAAGFNIADLLFVSARTNAVCLVLSAFPLFDLSNIEQRFKLPWITLFLKMLYLMLLLLTVPIGFIENMVRGGTTITMFARASK